MEQHLATRRVAGLFDFSFMGLYEFDRKSEIQALQTRDLDALDPGQIAYTLLLREDGAVLIDATVWRLDERRFWLITGKRAGYGGLDRSGEYAILALQGPASGAILARLIGRDPVLGLRYFRFIEWESMLIARLGYSGELGYELLMPAGHGAAIRRALLDRGVPECGWVAANSLRIESGYVLFDREVDGRANPCELGLARLVASARAFPMQRRLVGLEILEGAPGGELPQAQATSECLSPTLGKHIALGFAAPQARPGDLVRLGDNRPAQVARLPFHDPDRRLPRSSPL